MADTLTTLNAQLANDQALLANATKELASIQGNADYIYLSNKANSGDPNAFNTVESNRWHAISNLEYSIQEQVTSLQQQVAKDQQAITNFNQNDPATVAAAKKVIADAQAVTTTANAKATNVKVLAISGALVAITLVVIFFMHEKKIKSV